MQLNVVSNFDDLYQMRVELSRQYGMQLLAAYCICTIQSNSSTASIQSFLGLKGSVFIFQFDGSAFSECFVIVIARL